MQKQAPLDFTRGRSGAVTGLRWQVAFHLLDAVFFAAGERRLAFSPEFERSREARAILTDVEAAVTEGLRDKQVLQRCPHLVLADKRYYHSHLKEPLARWALLWPVAVPRNTRLQRKRCVASATLVRPGFLTVAESFAIF